MKGKCKNLFDKNLYIEALRRVFPLSLFTGVFCLVLALIIAISENNFTLSTEIFKELANPFAVLGVPIGMAFVLPILIVFVQFNHLFSRRGSDFYHSIPFSKKTVFCTLNLASITSILAQILIVGALSIAIYSCNVYRLVPTKEIVIILINLCIFSVAIYFIFLCAMSFSGTKFTSFIIAVYMIALPFLLDLFFKLMFNFQGKFDSIISLIERTSPFYLLMFGFLNTLFGGRVLNINTIINPWGILLSLAFLAVIIAITYFFFIRRKSEIASNATSSDKVQDIVRIILPLPILGFIPASIYLGSFELLLVTILFLVGVLIYLGFEFGTRKSGKLLLKSLPKFLISMGVVVVLTISSLLIGCGLNTQKIEGKDLSYAQIQTDLPGNTSEFYRGELMSYQIKDKEVLDILANAQNKPKYILKDEKVKFLIKPKFGNLKEVSLNLTKEELAVIYTKIDENQELNQLKYQIPDMDKLLDSKNYHSENPNRELKLKDEIVRSFYKEWETLSLSEKQDVFTHNVDKFPDTQMDMPQEFNYSIGLVLNLRHELNAGTAFDTYYISELMPKTADLLMQQKNLNLEHTMINFEKAVNDNATDYIQINISSTYNQGNTKEIPFDFNKDGAQEKAIKAFEKMKTLNKNFTTDEELCSIFIEYDSPMGKRIMFDMAYSITQEEFDYFVSLLD